MVPHSTLSLKWGAWDTDFRGDNSHFKIEAHKFPTGQTTFQSLLMAHKKYKAKEVNSNEVLAVKG